ncbi:hypothetical protein NDA12_001068 [Ustilago hordei]|nr:hypothetical protein NDA15_001895 [Ustilago hordei]KAJ1594361.1 hypothetical protein NDA12_001068 [Ustilago hordei]
MAESDPVPEHFVHLSVDSMRQVHVSLIQSLPFASLRFPSLPFASLRFPSLPFASHANSIPAFLRFLVSVPGVGHLFVSLFCLFHTEHHHNTCLSNPAAFLTLQPSKPSPRFSHGRPQALVQSATGVRPFLLLTANTTATSGSSCPTDRSSHAKVPSGFSSQSPACFLVFLIEMRDADPGHCNDPICRHGFTILRGNARLFESIAD